MVFRISAILNSSIVGQLALPNAAFDLLEARLSKFHSLGDGRRRRRLGPSIIEAFFFFPALLLLY